MVLYSGNYLIQIAGPIGANLGGNSGPVNQTALGSRPQLLSQNVTRRKVSQSVKYTILGAILLLKKKKNT